MGECAHGEGFVRNHFNPLFHRLFFFFDTRSKIEETLLGTRDYPSSITASFGENSVIFIDGLFFWRDFPL
jgi:hypothetical protein